MSTRHIEVEVGVENTATIDEMKEIEKLLTELNVLPTVKANYYRRSFGEILPWIVFLYLPFRKFLDALMAEAGKDFYKLLKGKIERLHQIRKAKTGSEGSIILVDTNTNIEFLLPSDKPEILNEAIEKLAELDLMSFKAGLLMYDVQEKRWKSSMGY